MALHNTHFRKMVFSTAEKLTALECSSLHYIYALPEKYRDCSNLEILKELQRKGCYSNAEGLAQILKGIHREDLANEVYCASGPSDGLMTSHGHKTPTQLRGKCDANIAQTNSLAKELEKIRNSFLDNGLAQSAMDDLYRELEEVDTSIQRALGRCGAMQRLCTSAKVETRAQNGKTESIRQGNYTLCTHTPIIIDISYNIAVTFAPFYTNCFSIEHDEEFVPKCTHAKEKPAAAAGRRTKEETGRDITSSSLTT